MERSKNWYSTTISSADTATTHSAWLLTLTGPSVSPASLNGGARAFGAEGQQTQPDQRQVHGDRDDQQHQREAAAIG